MSETLGRAARIGGRSIEIASALAAIGAGIAAFYTWESQLVGALVMTVGNLVCRVPKRTFLKWPVVHAAFVVIRLSAFNLLLLTALYWIGRGATIGLSKLMSPILNPS